MIAGFHSDGRLNEWVDMKSGHRVNRERIVSPLPPRVANLLIIGPHANLVAGTVAERALLLPEIASLHTRREMSAIRGLGRATLRKIEDWLKQHGRRFRRPDESLDTAICSLSFRDDWIQTLNKIKQARSQAYELT